MRHRELVKKTSNLSNINFTWHNKTAAEYESEMNEKKEQKKYEFIHMVQMLYYVTDFRNTVKFFRNCLAPNGKLLIILVSGNSGWNTLWKKYRQHFTLHDASLFITSCDVDKILDEQGAKYENHNLPSDLDISECFIQGNRNGELLLDFLTEICDFCKTVPTGLKAAILEDLKQPGCSDKKDGKVMFNNNLCANVIES